MTQTAVTIPSAGLKLSGVVHVPDDVRPGERRAAFLVLHGFGSNKSSSNTMEPTKILTGMGYVVLRFDMRGCGESEGERGNLICLEQVEDTSSALTYMAKRPEVDPDRIAVVGSSFGAAVAVYTGGVDKRVAAVISYGGWGDGERKFRGQHPTPRPGRNSPKCWRRARATAPRHGKSMMVPRYDIVPIPPHLRSQPGASNRSWTSLRRPRRACTISAPTMWSATFRRGRYLLLHSSNDSVTPTEQSIEMFKRAGQPSELHLIADVDHFMFAEGNKRVWDLVRNWLNDYFPVVPAVRTHAAE